tara:strand:+ start:503 stop:703 length:201 start_codon:yes stop_codon:yes gene_type:complete
MAKSMQVPILVFEKKEDAELLMSSLRIYKEKSEKELFLSEREKENLETLLDEVYKINRIYEKTNNS